MNTIGGISCWRAISTTHQIPVIAAAVILAFLGLIVSFCGYKFIHLYEKFAGYPVLMYVFSPASLLLADLRSATALFWCQWVLLPSTWISQARGVPADL